VRAQLSYNASPRNEPIQALRGLTVIPRDAYSPPHFRMLSKN
jgi:hypothetical protein